MAACTEYGPLPARPMASMPRRMRRRFHRDRFWSASSTGSPSGPVRALIRGGLELQQRHQAVHLGLLRHQGGEDTGEPEGVLAQGRADEVLAGGRRVPLVEDQVDHFEDGGEPLVSVRPVRDLEGHPGLGQGPLRPDDALGDGGLGDEERAGDLLGGEPAHQAQRQCDPGVGGQDGMAGGEDQPEQVVVDVLRPGRLRGRGDVLQGAADLGELAGVGLLAANEVDGAVFGRGHEPGARFLRDARLWPLFEGGDQGVLRDLLGDSDVPHDAGDTGDDARGLDPEHRLDRLGRRHCRHGHPSEQP
ncbi:hypothetical protein GCM10020254_72950 [Streptomyces goshikiensis]